MTHLLGFSAGCLKRRRFDAAANANEMDGPRRLHGSCEGLLPPISENEEQQDEDPRKASAYPERGGRTIFEAVEPARREAEYEGRKDAGKLSAAIAPEEGYGLEDAGWMEFHLGSLAIQTLASLMSRCARLISAFAWS